MITFESYAYYNSNNIFIMAMKNPKDENYFYLGLKFMDEGNMPSAALCFKKVLEMNAHHAHAHYYLSKCFYKIGLLEEAEKVLTHKDGGAFNYVKKEELLGDICSEDFRITEACQHYQNAIEAGGKCWKSHKALTQFLIDGNEVLGQKKSGCLQMDRKVLVNSNGQEVHAHVRVFLDLRYENKQLVLLTTEGDTSDIHPGDMGVTNGAEILIEYLINDKYYEISPDATFVLMHEKGVLETSPMHITLLDVSWKEIPANKVGILDKLMGIQTINPEKKFCDIKFLDISHKELEKFTGYRFFWE